MLSLVRSSSYNVSKNSLVIKNGQNSENPFLGHTQVSKLIPKTNRKNSLSCLTSDLQSFIRIGATVQEL